MLGKRVTIGFAVLVGSYKFFQQQGVHEQGVFLSLLYEFNAPKPRNRFVLAQLLVSSVYVEHMPYVWLSETYIHLKVQYASFMIGTSWY